MKSRERVRRAVRFEGPDRTPLRYFWVNLPPEIAHLQTLLDRYPNDFGSAWGAVDPNVSGIGEDGAVDLWGCQWSNCGHGPLSTGHPLEDWGALKHFRPPDPREYLRIETNADALKNRDDWYAVPWAGNLFERVISLRGYENAMLDFVVGPPELDLLIDMLVEHNERYMRIWMEHDIDGVTFSDDMGSTTACIIGPDSFRRYLKPAYKHLYEVAHERDLTVHLHSDGKIDAIVGDLAEIGLDALNLQSYLCGTKSLGERYAGKICFEPDPGRQDLWAFGTPEEVDSEVKRWVDCYQTDRGGLTILSFPQVGAAPPANTGALILAMLKYGCDWSPDDE